MLYFPAPDLEAATSKESWFLSMEIGIENLRPGTSHAHVLEFHSSYAFSVDKDRKYVYTHIHIYTYFEFNYLY